MDMLQGKLLLNKNMKLISSEKALQNKKIIVYYFTASWVTTFKTLDDQLTHLYEYAKTSERKVGLEIIYVSFDTEEDVFQKDYISKNGNWLAIPFGDMTAQELRWKFDITNLPVLIVVKRDGDIITRFGREELDKIGLDVIVTWSEFGLQM